MKEGPLWNSQKELEFQMGDMHGEVFKDPGDNTTVEADDIETSFETDQITVPPNNNGHAEEQG